MANDVTIFIRATDQTSHGINSARRGLDGFAGRLRSFTTGIVASIGAGFAVDKILDFGSELMSLSGQMDVWARKTRVVFEGSETTIRQWADGLNERLGMSDERLAGLAASFGDLLRPMGFTGDQAADLTTKAGNLAAALGEWAPQLGGAQGALDALAAAMTGEREQLKQYGIVIDEAMIQEELRARGLEDLEGNARRMAEADIALGLATDQSRSAQEAYNEGSPAAIEAVNNLKASWEEMKQKLAEEVVPTVTGFISWLTDEGIPKLEEFGQGVRDWMRDTIAEVRPEVEETRNRFDEFFARWLQGSDEVEGGANRQGEAMSNLSRRAIEALMAWGQWQAWITDKILGFGQVVFSVFKEIAGAIAAAWDFGFRNASYWIGLAVAGLKNLVSWAHDAAEALSNVSAGGVRATDFLGLGPAIGARVLFKQHGGIAGGWTMAGEKGPELIKLPGGSMVHSAEDTQRMMAPGGAGLPPINVYVAGSVRSDRELVGVIVDAARQGAFRGVLS